MTRRWSFTKIRQLRSISFPFSGKWVFCSEKDVTLVCLTSVKPVWYFPPNSLSFTGFDYYFLKNCSKALLLLSSEEGPFSRSGRFFSSFNIDMTFIISDRMALFVPCLIYLNLLPTPCEISHAGSFTSLDGNYLVPRFWMFCFFRYVFISTAMVSMQLSSLTSVRIEACIPVIWSYLPFLICTPAPLCSSSPSLQVIPACSQWVFHHLFWYLHGWPSAAAPRCLLLCSSAAPLLCSGAAPWRLLHLHPTLVSSQDSFCLLVSLTSEDRPHCLRVFSSDLRCGSL